MKNPKKVIDALSHGPAAVGEIELRPFSISTLVIMSRIKCPLLDQKEMGDIDIVRLIYALTHPAKTSYQLLDAGPKEYDEAAVEFGDGIEPRHMAAIGPKLKELFIRAMSTAPTGNDLPEKKTGGTENDLSNRSVNSQPSQADSAGS